MQWFQNFLREFLFIAFLYVVSSSASVAQASVDDKLELWFEYSGHQSTLESVPTIKCFRQTTHEAIQCDLYRSEDGRYWIDRPEPGSYLLRVWLKENGVELYREYPFSVTSSTTGPLLVALYRTLKLNQPEKSATATSVRAIKCRDYSEFSIPIFALFPNAELTFSWQALSDADEYHYKLWRVQCADDRRIEPMQLGRTLQDEVTMQVPASGSGEYYALELIALHGTQENGQLLLRDANGGIHTTYPFIVIDPLGERNWYPYVVAVIVIPLLLWLGWWLLSGMLMLRPGRGFSWTLILVVMVTAGYTQREYLLAWSEKGQQWLQTALNSQKWYRAPIEDEGYTPNQDFTSGSWRGFLVATDSKPFVGNSRRVEVSISFNDETARVSYLHNGRWQTITRGAFTISRSGAGMTLFGHLRDGQLSELWSISIADLSEPVLRLRFDRMITRRNANDNNAVSERREAIGELRHTLP